MGNITSLSKLFSSWSDPTYWKSCDLLDLTGEFDKYSVAADVQVDIVDLSITNSTPILSFSSVYPVNSN